MGTAPMLEMARAYGLRPRLRLLETANMHPISIEFYLGGDVKEFAPYHPYFTLISLFLKAASKPCKRTKNRERTVMKGR